jgi:ACT domain
MPAHLRVSLADRPGALASLTRALAAAGANVLSVTVLQRESGRAVDDLLLEWPFERPWDHVVRAVEGCAGARLHGLRHVATTEAPPDTTLVGHVLAQPHRALEVMVDTLPSLLLADWAAFADRRWPREPVTASAQSPLPLPMTPVALPRPRVLIVDDDPVMVLPCADSELRLLVGRSSGPGFTRTERERCAALLATGIELTRLAYRDAVPTPPSRVTASLVEPEAASVQSG